MSPAEKEAIGLSLTHLERRVPEALRILQQQALAVDAPPETVLHWHNTWSCFVRAVGELKGEHNERMVEWLEANGDLPINDEQRLRVGIEWDERCRDVRKAFDSLLTETQGDVEKIETCLSSNALKPGACGELLGSEWRKEHFERKSRKHPTTGKLKKAARVVQNRFVPKKEDRDGDSGE